MIYAIYAQISVLRHNGYSADVIKRVSIIVSDNVLIVFSSVLTAKRPQNLCTFLHVERLTIYHWFDAWEHRRFAGLYDHAGCGRPPKLTEAEQEQAHQYIAQHPQNMKKVVHLIEQETSKRVSTKTIKRLLKKTAMSGNGSSTHQRRARTLRSMSGVKP